MAGKRLYRITWVDGQRELIENYSTDVPIQAVGHEFEEQPGKGPVKRVEDISGELPGLRSILKKTHIPIVLTDTTLFQDREALPHWIALTGYSKVGQEVNNPLANTANSRVNEVGLRNRLGFQGVRCALMVRGLRRERVNPCPTALTS